MKKALLIVVGVVVVLVAIVAAVVLLAVSPASYKGAIIARLQAATGRQVTIAGPMSLSIFPELGVEASDVSLANVAGAANPEMVAVKRLDVAVTLIPLLHGRFQIDRFVLINPTIHLEIDAQGRPNWNFGPASPAAAPAAAAQPPAAGAGGAPAAPAAAPSASTALAALSRFSAAKMVIENGDITFADRRTGQSEELQKVDVTLALPAPNAPATLTGSATWRGTPITLSAGLADPGAIMAAGGTSALDLTLSAKPVTAKLDGTLAGAGTVASPLVFDGTAAIAMPSVRDFVAWSGIAVTLPPRGFGALSVSGKLHGTNGVAVFSDAKFALDAMTATGTATVDLASSRPTATATLSAGTIDLDPYLPAASASSGWSTMTFDIAPLRQVDGDLTVTAQGIRYRKVVIGKSDFVVHLKNAQLVLDINSVALYQGIVKGEIQLDATQPTARIAANLSLSGVSLRPFLSAEAGITAIGGAGYGTVNATGAGNSESALIASLNGKGAFRIANGAVGGVDLAGMLHNTASAFTGAGGTTSISAASGHFTIASGIVHNTDLVASMNGIDATGAGTVNLPQRTLDYRVTPRLVAGIVTVPVIVSGPWTHLRYQPDLAGIAQGLVETPGRAVKGAAGLGQSLGNGVGQVLKGLFGR